LNLYCAGCDPYAVDESQTSPSLGSMFVYKRSQGIDSFSDTFVAEYTGRPKTDEEFYEQCRRLAMYYNCQIMYENNIKGLYVYFAKKNSLHLLANQPTLLLRDIIQNSKVNREKGIHMTENVKTYMLNLIRQWLETEDLSGKMNLYKIMSEPLLQELINYNATGNFDRIFSMGISLMFREYLFRAKIREPMQDQTEISL